MSERPHHQFGLRSMLALTAFCAVLFGTFRWLGLTPRTSLFVAAILVVALMAAVSLVVAIGRSAINQSPPNDSGLDDDS